MQNTIKELLAQAVQTLANQAQVQLPSSTVVQIERTKDPEHGDFASNIALLLAKPLGQPPRKIAEQLIALLPQHGQIAKIEIAGPGFINFYLTAAATTDVIKEIIQKKELFGRSEYGAGKKILVEFVSANPTGPLHVGHGRGAAYGATVADVLTAVGFSVHREYYINDAGRQMDILATSIWLRYLQAEGEQFTFPSNGYRGDYLQPIIEKVQQQYGKKFVRPIKEVLANVPADEPDGGDKEAHIDGLIANAKKLLGDDFENIFEFGLTEILTDIREDLAEFGVNFQTWFSERQLVKEDAINQAFDKLQKAGYLYEQDGALWFRSTAFGDDKDRVVRRENGQTTYFAGDIAYHFNKSQRNYHQILDVLGADHHGYVPRIHAALKALGYPAENFHALLVQFAILYRNGERVQMSTRSGSFVTLRELREEVGNDAARFFYVLRKADQHLDFDLDLAKAQSHDNPLYYIQYAHARVCSVFKQLENKKLSYDQNTAFEHLNLLTTPHELALLRRLPQYPEILMQAALHYEPHRVAQYLRELANDLHSYYNAEVFLVEDTALRNARLCLVQATGQVIANGLHLLGVSAPEQM
jgi:arginyl-tRNA synthetase